MLGPEEIQALFRWDLLCNLTLLGEEQFKKYPVWYSQMTHLYCCWVLQKCTKYFRFWIVKISDQILVFPVCPQTSVLWEMLFDNNRESREVRTSWVHRFQRISNQFFSSRSQFKFPKDFVLKSSLNWNISDLKLDCLFLNFYHFFTLLLTSCSL